MSLVIVHSDNLEWLQREPPEKYNLIYVDPPFNTGTKKVGRRGTFADSFDDYIPWLQKRMIEAHRVLSPNGSLFLHLDYREIHYAKVMLDGIFGRENFLNEIIWHYDYGARAKKRWPAKHDNILWYVKNKKSYVFNYNAIDRIPYLAPGLVGPEKAKRGKTLTDCWQNTIVHTTGKERTGYPTQKPLKILERIVKVHSNTGDLLLDFFAGAGSFGEAALKHGRDVVLVDNSSKAISTMRKRLKKYKNHG